MIDGVLVVDKPQGLTSHDVVAVARRALAESRIGHTGTLDPLATGVLPLACGRATRLVRFLSSSDKTYEATIRFGLTTDSYDVTGIEISRSTLQPERDALIRAVASLSGEYLQTPPAYSAKKVAGRRAYEMARRREPVALAAVAVRVARAELLAFDGASARVTITCSAGFYVRSFAHTLGERVGTGACLEELRRTRSGEFSLSSAVTLDQVRHGRIAVAQQFVTLERLLGELPAARLTEEGRRRVSHGQEIDAADMLPAVSDPGQAAAVMWDPPSGSERPPSGGPENRPAWVRLLDGNGQLLALATPGAHPGSLHPAVVLI